MNQIAEALLAGKSVILVGLQGSGRTAGARAAATQLGRRLFYGFSWGALLDKGFDPEPGIYLVNEFPVTDNALAGVKAALTMISTLKLKLDHAYIPMFVFETSQLWWSPEDLGPNFMVITYE